MASSWHKARDLLQDALLKVHKLSSSRPCDDASRAGTLPQPQNQAGASSSSCSSSVPSSILSAFEEHRRIYGYKPLASTVASKGKRSKAHSRTAKWLKIATYTKDTICIMYREQTWLPTTEERIELAKLGLGLKSSLLMRMEMLSTYMVSLLQHILSLLHVGATH